MRILIILPILLLMAFCTSKKVREPQDIIKYSQKDSMMYKFIVLYNSYTNATLNWHPTKDFSIIIHSKKYDDTLNMYFFANSERDITSPIVRDCKLCYFIDGHYVFVQENIFSFAALNIDTVYKKINPECYLKYFRKEIIPPPEGWDPEFLFVKLVNNKLKELKFGFDKEISRDFRYKATTVRGNGH